jgi:hypothetical protein
MIMTWDIRPGREQEYSEFINDRLAPGLVELGLPPSDVFFTTYGRVPQIMVILDVEDEAALQKATRQRKWANLKNDLLNYIENYREKVVRADSTGYF